MWIRWLVACKVPMRDIAILLDAAEVAIVDYLERPSDLVTPFELARMREMKAAGMSGREIGPAIGLHYQTVYRILRRGVATPFVPSGPPRHPDRGKVILGQTATKVRRLVELDYDAGRIAEILDLDPVDVSSFIDRSRPIRKDRLVRPRGREEHRRAMRPRRRPLRRPSIDPADAWRYRDDDDEGLSDAWRYRDDDDAPEVAEVEPPAPTPIIEPLPADPWSGPTTCRATGAQHGSAKLTEPDVVRILSLHGSGLSIYSLAKEYKVNQGTIRAIVRRETWTHVCPAPTSAPPDGPEVRKDR